MHDSEDDKPAAGYVTTLPGATAEMWTADGKTTVAEDNPEYPSEAQVGVGVNENERHHISASDRSTQLERTEIRESTALPVRPM